MFMLLSDLGVRPGDVLASRSNFIYGKAIRRCLPNSWSDHNGTVVKTDIGWGIAEALACHGFVITPWKNYVKRIESGKTSVVFLRVVDPKGYNGLEISDELGEKIQREAENMSFYHIRYDIRAIFGIWFNLIFKTNIKFGKEWKWYCTNSVATQHWKATEDHRLDVWNWRSNPTPYTTEKRHAAGKLIFVNQIIASGHPKYRRKVFNA